MVISCGLFMDKNLLKNFEKAFHELYRPLCLYALNYTQAYEDSEDIVQQLFTDVWEKLQQKELNIVHLKSYLYTAVKNRSLNHCHKEKIFLPIENQKQDLPEDDYQEALIRESCKEARMWDWIDALPKERRTIFLMAKQKGMKYQEIANELKLSVKTVENQMGKALKTLREKAIKIYLFFFG